jgi:hypothetical protein
MPEYVPCESRTDSAPAGQSDGSGARGANCRTERINSTGNLAADNDSWHDNDSWFNGNAGNATAGHYESERAGHSFAHSRDGSSDSGYYDATDGSEHNTNTGDNSDESNSGNDSNQSNSGNYADNSDTGNNPGLNHAGNNAPGNESNSPRAWNYDSTVQYASDNASEYKPWDYTSTKRLVSACAWN